jgi:hypothetical protein
MSAMTPLPVAGYTTQSEQNVALVNQNKRIEEMVLRQLDLVAQASGVDARWFAVGRRHIETGFMEVNRSIFKPERLKGELK